MSFRCTKKIISFFLLSYFNFSLFHFIDTLLHFFTYLLCYIAFSAVWAESRQLILINQLQLTTRFSTVTSIIAHCPHTPTISNNISKNYFLNPAIYLHQQSQQFALPKILKVKGTRYSHNRLSITISAHFQAYLSNYPVPHCSS